MSLNGEFIAGVIILHSVSLLEAVEALYEARPYPPTGLLSPLQPLRRDDLPLLNYRAAYSACFGSTKGAAERPRILVVGCGTVEPVAVAMANPGSEILAVDLSARSLDRLRWQARWRGVSGQIRMHHGDLENIPRNEGRFDYVVATGVLHHLENPERALKRLVDRTYAGAVFRIMVYSRWGRDLLYGAKALAQEFGISEPKSFRRMIDSLPSNHPYRIYFHLYDDARTDGGLCDGYLHPCDQPRDALGWQEFLNSAGLEAKKFLQRPDGQPHHADVFAKFKPGQGLWERMALLEAIGQLEENFYFFASLKSDAGRAAVSAGYEWNPSAQKKGSIHSKLLGEKVDFDPSRHPGSFDEATRSRLLESMLLLPKGGPR